MATVLTADDLLRDLDEMANEMIEETRGLSLVRYTDTQWRRAGAISYVSDKLVEIGFDRAKLSDEHGFGRIAREAR